jgi:DNA-binding IclR family transcriptional regulator
MAPRARVGRPRHQPASSEADEVQGVSYVLQSADHLLDLLVYVGSQGGSHSISDLARQLGTSFSRAYRLVATLEQKGFLERDATTKRYQVGRRAYEVGMQYLAGRSLIGEARPYLERLVALSNETALLVLRDGNEVVYIDQVDSPRAVKFQTSVGSRIPWNCSASGKALVSLEPEAVVEELLRRPLTPCSSTGGVDPTSLRQELNNVRAKGYALSMGAWNTDAAAAAVAVVDMLGRPVAAIVLAAPAARTDWPQLDRLGMLLRDTLSAVRLAAPV